MGFKSRNLILGILVLVLSAGGWFSCGGGGGGGGPEPAPGPAPVPKEEGPPKDQPVVEEPKVPQIQEPSLPQEPKKDFRVPELVGKSYVHALDTIVYRHLTLGKVNYKGKKGATTIQVTAQSPPPHAWVKKGDKLSLDLTGPEGKPVPVPPFAGKTLKEAETLLKEKGLHIGTLTIRLGKPGAKKEEVTAQVPPAGTPSFKGAGVNLTLSMPGEDAKKLKTPALAGKPLEDALRLIYASGFSPGPVKWKKDAKPAGTILEQDPLAGKPINLGASIRLTLAAKSLGIPVPDLSGKTVQEASKILGAAGLRLGTVRRIYGKAQAMGKIVGQDPAKGSKAPPEAEVSLTLVGAKANPPFAAVRKSLTVEPNTPFSLDAGRSKAYGGRTLKTYQWKRGKDALPPSKDPVRKEKGLKTGTYKYTLVVVDSLGLSSKPATVEVTVKEALVPVPNVVGKLVAAAKGDLTKAGLILGKTLPRPGKGKPGAVLAQTPKPREKVKKGTAVDLEVGAEKEKVAVPPLAGKPLATAKAELLKAGLVPGKVTPMPGQGKPGEVVATLPGAGQKVEKGSTVNLQVGAEKPKETVAVPALSGKTLADAKAELRKAGLVPGKVTPMPGKGKPGEVVATVPAAGQKVEKGATVDLQVGAEKPKEMVAVPAVAGKALTAAKIELMKAGLVPGKVTPMPGKGKPGEVLSTIPGAGQKVGKGTKVDLQVGAEKPKETVAVPAVLGKPLEEAKTLLTKA
ncbi:MAG: PASTA domain-containing protein, partial [Planctomycetota bacterium]